MARPRLANTSFRQKNGERRPACRRSATATVRALSPTTTGTICELPRTPVTPPAAPITIELYTDYECPACRELYLNTLPGLEKDFISTGKVKLVYRDFPLDQMAAKAAQLAKCAGNDKYFAVMDMIFATQGTWAAAQDPIAVLSKSLRIAGMGDKEVQACLANEAVRTAVIADYQMGEQLGVNSTPTLFINGEKYSGARSAEELDALFAKLTSK